MWNMWRVKGLMIRSYVIYGSLFFVAFYSLLLFYAFIQSEWFGY